MVTVVCGPAHKDGLRGCMLEVLSDEIRLNREGIGVQKQQLSALAQRNEVVSIGSASS